MTRIRVALFINRAKAEPIRQRLASEGVSAIIHEEPPVGRLWFVSKSAGGVSIEAKVKEFDRAYRLLQEWGAAGDIEGAIRCPDCQSFRVDYPQFTRKSMLTNVAMGLTAQLGLVPKEYYCEDCHFTWPKEGKKHSAGRPHMAPYYFIEGVLQTDKQSHAETDRRAA